MHSRNKYTDISRREIFQDLKLSNYPDYSNQTYLNIMIKKCSRIE